MTFLLVCTLQITAILLMALLAQPLLRKKSAAARHWVLSAGVVFSAIVPLLNVVMPSWNVPAAISRHPAIVPIAIALPAPRLAESAAIAGKSDMPVEHSARTDRPRWFVPAIWSGGTLAGLVALITGLVRLVRVAATSSAIQGGPWIELAEQISKEYRLRLPVHLLMSLNSSILITFGVVRPKVILPAGSMEWPPDRARIVLRHELAHVRRSDWLVQMIAQCLRIVYWFNPLVWIVWNHLRLESECACDDAVIAGGSEGHEYAAHLLHLARTLNRIDRAWSEAMTMFRPSTIERRFSAMLNPVLNRRPVTRTIMFATILTGLAVTLPLTMVSTAKEVPPGLIMESPTLPAPETPERIEAASQAQPTPQPESEQPSEQPARVQNLRGSQQQYQQFEVVSIKPVSNNYASRFACRAMDGTVEPYPRDLPMAPAFRDVVFRGQVLEPAIVVAMGRCLGQIPLGNLVAIAYNIPSRNVFGGPDWARPLPPRGLAQRFEIQAKAADVATVTKEQLRQMLQFTLGDRFKLNLHWESRESEGYALIVGKNGVKIKEASGEEEAPYHQDLAGGKVIVKGKSSLNTLAAFLLPLASYGTIPSPIIDKTNLGGMYEYTLTLQRPAQGGPRGGGDIGGQFDPPLGTALEEQLGLRLQPTKVQAEVIVIDNVEKPSEN